MVSLSDHRTTLPPLPRPVADALMVVAASMLTVVAVGITKLSSLALGLATRPLFGLPPPQSPPISTLPPPARPEASTRALASLMSSPVTRIVPPCVPFFLPAAASVPEILTVWVAAPAGLLAPVAALSTIMPLWRPIELALITPAGVDDGIDDRARGRGGELDPPAVRAERAARLLTSDLSGWPVATSITFEAIWSLTASVISLSPYRSSVKPLPEASATVPSVAVMVPELRTPGATSAAKPPLVAVMRPWLTIEASGRPGMLKL